MDMKQSAFVLLVILVAISGLYQWTQTDEILKQSTSLEEIGDFHSDTLVGNITSFQINFTQVITTSPLLDPFGFVGALLSLFGLVFNVFMKLVFGWMDLVDAIFSSMGLSELSVIFSAPLAIIQLFALLYFARDLVNTIRGVGG